MHVYSTIDPITDWVETAFKMSAAVVEHVVADAGAFLKNAPLQDIGKNIYTIKEVVNEIRDKETKKRLAFLPYTLQFKDPFPEFIQLVTEFSKKTGDYPSLSATDIKVLALTYQLESEHVGINHLKHEPEIKVQVSSTRQHPEAPVNIAGFHLPSKKHQKSAAGTGSTQSQTPESSEFNTFQFWRNPLPSIEADLLDFLNAELVSVADSSTGVGDHLSRESHDGDYKEGSEEEEEKAGEARGGDDDDGGWITPSNLKQIQQDMGCCETPSEMQVGCLTTDFAMQNVLIQIGLHVLSVSGMLITQARSYILRCHACFKTTSNMTKVFCPNCGNKTLKKIAVTIKEDGSFQMHFSRNPKVLNPKGMRYSLPKPQGGKHANNPHLVEDQHFPQQRLSRKARQKTNVFDPDYTAGGSPFAENDIYSRAANLNIRDSQSGAGRRRVNPNTANKKFVKKR
ncbi:RNA-binding protein NOB1-like isoform X2 [Acipenser ruthenus]|uniref:RNA-binding protein NOB1-like isoform X2 n=1 Tax=Acipenser ruthenus TaxID=7906 RepID=UPI0027429693|nr:RNA-binding protein NOB1-like isoform X2 [Acipenser ruthenus]